MYACFLLLGGGGLAVLATGLVDSVRLRSDNHVTILGEINDTTSTQFSNDLYSIITDQNLTRYDEDALDLYVYIDSPGGYVESGLKMLSEIKKYNLSCVAVHAYSMAFTLFQACAVRLIADGTGRLMQHQMSYGVMGNHLQILSHIDLMKQMNSYLTKLQADRIGVTPDVFEQLVSNDWWLFSDVAVERNCADKAVQVWCSDDLVRTNRCPLVERGS